MADHDQPKGGGAAAAAPVAYFNVVTASSAAAGSSPVGTKRPRPAIDEEQCVAAADGNSTGTGKLLRVSAGTATTTKDARRSPAKSAIVSIENLLRAAQGRAGSDATTTSSTTAQPNADAADASRALSWKDDNLANSVMQLPPVLPQIAFANPQLYAARMKMIADPNRDGAAGEGGGLGQPKRKRKKKDPNQPKKARSAYSYFVIEFHENIKAEKEQQKQKQQQQQQQQQQRAGGEGGEEKKEDNDNNDDDDDQQRFQKMGQQWRDLNGDDRKKYDDLAAKDKERHAAEMEVYAKKQKKEAAAAMSKQTNDEARAAAGGSKKQQPKKLKAPRTPTANRLVSGNRSADGGVLGTIGSGGAALSSSSSKRTHTPAKCLKSAPAPEIGEGWTIKTYQRQTGSSAGTTDSYWYSPALEKKFRSLKEVDRFKQALARVHADAGGKLDAAHAERLAWRAFKQAAAGAKKQKVAS